MDTNTWAPPSPDLSSAYYHNPAEQPQYPAPAPAYTGSLSHLAPPFPPPNPTAILQSHTAPQPYMPRGVNKEESMQDADYMPDASVPAIADAADTPNTDGITIKNHFPVARIKRIMQADDDVGKVAQVTPVVVCTYLVRLHMQMALTLSQQKHWSSL